MNRLNRLNTKNFANGTYFLSKDKGKENAEKINEIIDALESVVGDPAGTNTQVQYNNNGVFGGSSNFTWNGVALTVKNAASSPIIAMATSGSHIELLSAAGAVYGAIGATGSNVFQVYDNDLVTIPFYITNAGLGYFNTSLKVGTTSTNARVSFKGDGSTANIIEVLMNSNSEIFSINADGRIITNASGFNAVLPNTVGNTFCSPNAGATDQSFIVATAGFGTSLFQIYNNSVFLLGNISGAYYLTFDSLQNFKFAGTAAKLGISIDATATLHVKGETADNTTFALKIQNSALNESFNVRNDGNSSFNNVALDGTKLYINGGTTGANTYAFRIDGDSANIFSVENAGNITIGTVGGVARMYIKNDGNIAINYSGGAVSGTKVYIDGGLTASNTYAFRIDGDGAGVFYAKNNGRINMGSLPTSAVGLVAGDLWNDTGTIKIV